MFLPAVVIVLILLSYLMYWTKVEQHSLFVLYIIQVRFKNKKQDMIWKEEFKVSSYVWTAGFIIVFVHLRLPAFPCKASWTVWFTPGEGPTSRRLFWERTHPWWDTTALPSLMNHWGARPVDSKHTKRHFYAAATCTGLRNTGCTPARFFASSQSRLKHPTFSFTDWAWRETEQKEFFLKQAKTAAVFFIATPAV